jgi:hypothetical protein
MPIHVVWYDETKTIIVWEFDGAWEWQDYHAAINTAVVMIKSVNHVVDSIMDVRRNRSLPPNALKEGKRWFVVAPSNFGVTVVAGGSGLIRGIATTIGAVYKQFSERILIAATVDDAVKIINEKKRSRGQPDQQ